MPCMMLELVCGVLLRFVECVNGAHLFFASDKNAASALYPVSRTLVWTMWVHRRYATYFHVFGLSPVHCSDSNCLVRSRTST